jgi:adenosine kinase
VHIALTGSIATDHLMTYKGRFADSLVVDELDKIALSFLVQDLEIHRGGVAANIAFGMANLGQRPILVGSAGDDFAEYRSWLERHGVDCESVHISQTRHTARFICTTDDHMAQIATFYAGAMTEAREIELGPISTRVGGLDLAVISSNDPQAMLRHTQECRTRKIPFAADPSQQLAFMDGESIRELIDGATYLFTNEYEAALTEQKTGWSSDEIADHVQTRVITKGKNGALIATRGEVPIEVSVADELRKADPTGVGDAFRAGFLSGVAWGLGHERSAQVGSMLATYVVETIGTQEYELGRRRFLERFTQAYGEQACEEVEPHLSCPRP